jgi:hypothetical protein
MQTDLWFSQTGGVVPLLPYGELTDLRVLPNYVDGENRLSMGLPMENATQEEIANDVGSIERYYKRLSNSDIGTAGPLPLPTIPTQRGCGSNQYALPFKIQGEEKCVDKTIAMVLGAIAIYYIVKK